MDPEHQHQLEGEGEGEDVPTDTANVTIRRRRERGSQQHSVAAPPESPSPTRGTPSQPASPSPAHSSPTDSNPPQAQSGIQQTSSTSPRTTPISPPPFTHTARQGSTSSPFGRVSMSSEREEGYPSWLPRRPPPPAPASTVASEAGNQAYGHGRRTGSGNGNGYGTGTERESTRPGHRQSMSYDTGVSATSGGFGTGTGTEEGYDVVAYDDLDVDMDDEEEEEEEEEEEGQVVGIGRRQTPRSVRITLAHGHGHGPTPSPRTPGGEGGAAAAEASGSRSRRRSSRAAGAAGDGEKGKGKGKGKSKAGSGSGSKGKLQKHKHKHQHVQYRQRAPRVLPRAPLPIITPPRAVVAEGASSRAGAQPQPQPEASTSASAPPVTATRGHARQISQQSYGDEAWWRSSSAPGERSVPPPASATATATATAVPTPTPFGLGLASASPAFTSTPPRAHMRRVRTSGSTTGRYSTLPRGSGSARGVHVPSTITSQGYAQGYANGHGHGHTPSQTPLLTPVPRFGVPALMLKILQRPGWTSRAAYMLWPVWVYAPVVVQTYLDFSGAWCLIQLARKPTPLAVGVRGTASARNWSLGAAVYIALWAIWIIGVVLVYEVVYCWWRRWRVKHPRILPLYLSAPAFNLVCMTSYLNFCFMWHVRSTARPSLTTPLFNHISLSSSSSSASASAQTPAQSPASPTFHRRVQSPLSPTATSADSDSFPNPLASWRDWFAETFFFYGQNLPTVALLLPRVALCLAMLLAYSSPQPLDVALASGSAAGVGRDGLYFSNDGSLSSYAEGVLWTNVAWGAWRTLLLLVSWVGLWILSGQLCGGICGPRFRWEEERLEAKQNAAYDPDTEQEYYHTNGYPAPDDGSGIMSTWGWRECTRARIQEAFEFCLVLPLSTREREKARERIDEREKDVEDIGDDDEGFEGIERVLAAVGLPGGNGAAGVGSPPRRGVLREELYETPPEMHRELPKEYHDVDVPAVVRTSGGSGNGSSKGSKSSSKESKTSSSKDSKRRDPARYPFVGYPAQASSEDPQPGIPFPPSPTKSSAKRRSKESGQTRSRSASERDEGHEEEADVDIAVEGTEEHHGDDEEDEYGDDLEGLEDYEMGIGVEEPSSSGRASGSMSSLGQQIPSRFPFQFRHVQRRGRSSVGTQSKSMSSGRTRDSISASLSASMSTPERISQTHSQSQQSQSSPSHEVSSSGFHSPSEAGSGPSSPMSIPMPPRHPQRRDRSSMPTMSDVAAVAFPPFTRSLGAERARTESASTTASRTFGPQPPVYESSEEDNDEHQHVDEMGVVVVRDSDEGSQDGSQEAAEREDSVGLLSGGRSPRSSLGGLRSRSNLSLTNISLHRRSRHSSHSGSSNNKSGSGRSMSAGASVRSRAQSLIQSLGAASRSTASIEMVIRSRASSLARLSEVESTGSGHGAGSRQHSFSNSNSGSGSGSHSHSYGARSDEHTFGLPMSLRMDSPIEGAGYERASSNGNSRMPRPEDVPIPPTPPSEHEMGTGEENPGSAEETPTPASASQSQSTTPRALAIPTSLHPVPPPPPPPIPTPGARLQPERSFVSSANESLVTAPAATEGSSDTAGRSASSYGTIHHYAPDPPPQGGASWHPA